MVEPRRGSQIREQLREIVGVSKRLPATAKKLSNPKSLVSSAVSACTCAESSS